MKNFLSYFLFFGLIYFLAGSCAQIGQPLGGPRDTISPRMVRSLPSNFSKNVDKKKITLFFNEFVDLKEVAKVFVSPPLKENPEYTSRGKSIDIQIYDTLIPNTTYTFNFGNCIQDFTENNPLKSFQFVFGTGDHVDSLEISGKVLDAFTHKPVEDAWVMAYENFNDSTPYKTIPDYVGKTNKLGIYSIKNIRKTKYRLFALKEGNNNYKYDALNEEIAYTKTIYSPDAKRAFVKDTIKIKSNPKDTVGRDTIIFYNKTIFSPDSVVLYSFKEGNGRQFCSGVARNSRDRLAFGFNKPFFDSISIKPLNFSPKGKWFIAENTAKGDSLICWITDKSISLKDSLSMIIYFDVTEINGTKSTVIDTVIQSYTAPEVDEKEKKRSRVVAPPSPALQISFSQFGTIEPGQNFMFTLNKPAIKQDFSKISLFELLNNKEKTEKPLIFKIIPDSILARKYRMEYKWEEAKSYKLIFYPGAFTELNGLTNDTLKQLFTVGKEDMYGTLSLKMSNIQHQVLLQVLEENGNVAQELCVKKNSDLSIKYLKPGKYKLQAIIDKNKNGRWDTGKYIGDIQPEEILLFNKKIIIKAGWEQQAEWDFKK